jgi:glycine/D-amino acid oxidase-like deaminating enzyme
LFRDPSRQEFVVASTAVPQDLPVVVIGAGPVGLAAASHLAQQGLPFLVLEAGADVGASVAQWRHVRLFSPWRYDVDAAAGKLLAASGWQRPPDDELPTGGELVERYLRPLAAVPAVAPHVRYDARVTALSRLGFDRVRTAGREDAPFVVRLAGGEEVLARAVIDASGTWRTPNPLGVHGLPARGESELADAGLVDQALPDVLGAARERYAGRRTLVVGAGHSAANTLLALAELADAAPGTTITWAVRRGAPDRAFGGGDDDALPGRGALGSGVRMLLDSGKVELVTGFGVRAVRRTEEGRVEVVDASGRTLVADRVVAATGYRPDHAIARELRLDPDPVLESTRALAPLIDPNEHSCGTVRPHGVDELTHPEPGYVAVGMKSYGRAPTFLLATGYEQVRSVVSALAGDWAAARDVRLDLPGTGVCSTTLGARALMRDAAERHGLAPDVPALLVATAIGHLPATDGNVGAAVAKAAAELGVDADVAAQLATLAGQEFDTAPDTAAGDAPVLAPARQLLTVAGTSAGTAGGGCGA